MEPLAIASQVWQLPPLILHPFSETNGASKLVESSRAHLILQGLLPGGEVSREKLDQQLLDGRYHEIRMLFYVGRDVVRWIEQSLETILLDARLEGYSIRFQSLAHLLINDTPENVSEKLRRWGVMDYQSIFTRAIALNTIFAEAPPRELMSDEFVRNYYRFADHLFACRQRGVSYTELRAENFHFDLFASGEYSKMLEDQWSQN